MEWIIIAALCTFLAALCWYAKRNLEDVTQAALAALEEARMALHAADQRVERTEEDLQRYRDHWGELHRF